MGTGSPTEQAVCELLFGILCIGLLISCVIAFKIASDICMDCRRRKKIKTIMEKYEENKLGRRIDNC